MILIGQYDSPFVRRVGIALTIYGFDFEHRPWSAFGEADKIARYNPLRRVPTLVLEGGEALVESAAMLDHLDELAGASRALIAESGPDRRRALRLCALATGAGDKAVSLFYEHVLHSEKSQRWIERCEAQIAATLDVLEADRAGAATPYWLGERIGHADIAAACVIRFIGEAHGPLWDARRWPALAAQAARCEALAPFQEIYQAFSPPA